MATLNCALWHWLKRHCTARGRVIGTRLLAAYELRVMAERTGATRAAILQRAVLESHLFRR